MSLFSANDAADDAVINELLRCNFDEHVVNFAEHSGGANSKVFVATTAAGTRYFVKRYRSHSSEDKRNRLSTEFSGLSFLRANGIRQIPKPLCQDQGGNLGVYEYIEGQKLQPGEVSVHHLDLAAEFIAELFGLGQAPGAVDQPLASEACLSLRSYVEVVQRRLDRLLTVSVEGESGKRLRSYLENDFSPFFRRGKNFFAGQTAAMGLDPEALLPLDKRILSPSDFGFHNVIVVDGGHLVFIDFEYYGWDDPAQLIADFFLQPAVPVPPRLRSYFFERVDFLVANDGALSKRLPVVYLFSALKWCLLLLNCFLDNDLIDSPGKNEIFTRQFELSNKYLHRLEDEFTGGVYPFDLS